MKFKKILFVSITGFIIGAISSCSTINEPKSDNSSVENKSSVNSDSNSTSNVSTNPENNTSVNTPVDSNYLPDTKKAIHQINQNSSFSGKCLDNSRNLIQTQENFIGGTIICAGNINIITFKPERDTAGHKFQLVVKILASDHQWKLGSVSDVEGTNKGLSILMDDELNKGSEKEILSTLSTQIAVGTASKEGNDKLEKQRAHQRAVEIRKFINKNYGVKPKYLLNLGRFNEDKCNKKHFRDKNYATKYQRPIIIMSIVREHNVIELEKKDVEKSIKKNLDSLGFGLSYQCYSNFDLGL